MTAPGRRSAARCAVVVLSAWLLLTGATEATASVVAAASCPTQPDPSPYRFTGTVDRVQEQGRVAFVTTSAGKAVQVDGRGTRGAGPRAFNAGESYEFDPINATSPYLDNSCSATHQLGDKRFSPDTLLVLAIIIGMIFSAPRLARWIRRRGSPRP